VGIEEVRAFFEELGERWPLEALTASERVLDELQAQLSNVISGTGRDEPREAVAALRTAREAVEHARSACRAADTARETYLGDL